MYEWVVFTVVVRVRMLFTCVVCWGKCIVYHYIKADQPKIMKNSLISMIHNKKRKSHQFPNPTTCTVGLVDAAQCNLYMCPYKPKIFTYFVHTYFLNWYLLSFALPCNWNIYVIRHVYLLWITIINSFLTYSKFLNYCSKLRMNCVTVCTIKYVY